jgi:hypothetical protein
VGYRVIGVLHLIADAEDPSGIVARLMAAVPAGSYLAISHPALDTHQAQAAAQWGASHAIGLSVIAKTRR